MRWSARRTRSRVSSSADSPPIVGFAFLDARVRAAVQRAAVGDPDPNDPLRGLYISDEQALNLAEGERVVPGDERLADAAGRLGLDALDTAGAGPCAAPPAPPPHGGPFC